MRSRYTAFAYADADYLFRTWHPRTRPPDFVVDPEVTWTGLDVIAVAAGGPDDIRGEVEFKAHFVSGGSAGSTQERSSFERRAGRWFYLEALASG